MPTHPHLPAIVIGGGQAGLSASHYLKEQGLNHLIFEKNEPFYAWKNERWDSFCLVTPNHQCHLPGYHYQGDDPDGFMVKDELIAWFQGYLENTNPPLRTGVTVLSVTKPAGHFLVETTAGTWTTDAVICATGSYHTPFTPPGSDQIPPHIKQVFPTDYRNPSDIPPGAVAVIGTGQSGCQLAEELHLEGRKVHLCLGNAPRSPRKYRGKDAVTWLEEMGYYKLSIDQQPNPDKARNTNHYLTGRDGGHEIDLRKFATEGMKLYGYLEGIDQDGFTIRPDAAAKLDSADQSYLRIRQRIDDYIAREGLDAPEEPPFEPCWHPETEATRLDFAAENITSILWCIGFKPNFRFLHFDIFDPKGYPTHQRGITTVQGLVFVGLPWQHTWGSGRLLSVAEDAQHVVTHLSKTLQPQYETAFC
ncbi:MAG: MSMEG_0569 family flavin-dependent oxidoreductase [Verrucomicrobiota bacterium]